MCGNRRRHLLQIILSGPAGREQRPDINGGARYEDALSKRRHFIGLDCVRSMSAYLLNSASTADIAALRICANQISVVYGTHGLLICSDSTQDFQSLVSYHLDLPPSEPGA